MQKNENTQTDSAIASPMLRVESNMHHLSHEAKRKRQRTKGKGEQETKEKKRKLGKGMTIRK